MGQPLSQEAGIDQIGGTVPILSDTQRVQSLGAICRLYQACPICDSSSGTVLGRLKYELFANSPVADDFEVVSCVGCGYVSCNTPSSQQDFDRFYEHYYYSPAYVAHEIPPEENQYFADVVQSISKHLTESRPSVFDIGCGIGGMLRKFRELGYNNLFAIDPSPACVDFLANEGFQAALGSVQDIPFADSEPGVIVLSHIVEHLVDMKQALRSVWERLERGGVVYVEVPDAAAYEEFRPGIPLQYFYLQHVVHFDEHQLDSLFHANGFRKLEGGRRVRDENCFVTPALWGVYERATNAPTSFTPNFDLARTVKGWFGNSTLDPDGSFAALAASGKRVFVWGVGTHVQLMLGMSPLRDCNLIACVDQDPKLHGQTIAGTRIEPLSVLQQATSEDAIVVGSLVHGRKMAEQLRAETGFCGEVLTFSRDWN